MVSMEEKRRARIEDLHFICVGLGYKTFDDIFRLVRREHPFLSKHTQKDYSQTILRMMDPKVRI